MKKAFTLVELLITILVLVTLMSIVFRLSSIGADTTARSTTINRLHRLENCLSGYYAAFGSYPAVRLHNSRNYKLAVSDRHHVQNLDGNENGGDDLVWEQVRAACRAQPVNCDFPFPQTEEWKTLVDALSDEMAAQAQEWQDAGARKEVFLKGFSSDMRGILGKYTDLSEWREVQVFRFGLLSFLLPRYLFMMNGDLTIYQSHAQWKTNNELPCDPMTGERFSSWQEVQKCASSDDPTEYARVANIQSQVVCARWLPNLKGIVRFNQTMTFYGVTVSDGDTELPAQADQLDVHSPGGYDEESLSSQYLLDNARIADGWGSDFYYYSPPPYQSYVLWSGGPDKKTFPPWGDRETLGPTARATAESWTADDIVGMSK